MSQQAAKSNPVKISEDGSAIVSLPYSKQVVTLRRPKGKDIESIELASKGAQSNTSVLIAAIAVLSGMTADEVADLDAEDVGSLGDALSTFRVFAKLLEA